MKITAKLICSFMAMALLSSSLGLYAIYGGHKIQQEVERLFYTNLAELDHVTELSLHIQRAKSNVHEALLSHSIKDRKAESMRYLKSGSRLQKCTILSLNG